MGNTIVNKELGFTEAMAHNLLMQNKKHSLWNKPFRIWTLQDCESLMSGIDEGSKHKRHIRYQRVSVTLNDGRTKEYASVKSVVNVFKINQCHVSNVLAGRRTTTAFKSIQKI